MSNTAALFAADPYGSAIWLAPLWPRVTDPEGIRHAFQIGSTEPISSPATVRKIGGDSGVYGGDPRTGYAPREQNGGKDQKGRHEEGRAGNDEAAARGNKVREN